LYTLLLLVVLKLAAEIEESLEKYFWDISTL